jgi:hypothetical protein
MEIKYICIYTLLHKSEFSTVYALTNKVNLHDLVNMNVCFYMVFLKLQTFCEPYNNFGQKKMIILFGWSDNFLLRGWHPW